MPPSEYLEIFALLPFRYFRLEVLDLGVLDVYVVADELCAERLAEKRIVSAVTASRRVFGSRLALVS